MNDKEWYRFILTGSTTWPHTSNEMPLEMLLAKSTRAGLLCGAALSTKICGLHTEIIHRYACTYMYAVYKISELLMCLYLYTEKPTLKYAQWKINKLQWQMHHGALG